MGWFSGIRCYWDILFCSHSSLRSPGKKQRGRQPAALELEGGTISPHMTRWFWYTTTSCRSRRCCRLHGVGGETILQQLQPIYATICYIWRCTLEGKVRHTTRTSTISRLQLVLRHTLSNRHARTHTHSETIECSPTLTHETEQLATKKTKNTLTLLHSGWFTGPWAYIVIRAQPFDKCIISGRKITFLCSSH